VRWGVCAVAVAVLAGDQVSKSLVLAARPGPSGGGVVSVRLVRNTGASFGLGAGHPIVVVLVAVAIIAIVAVLLARTRSRAAALCLAAVLGGALGNLADRLFRAPGLGRGAVVDWIHVAVYPATFNIADLAIRVGAVGAVIAMLDIRVRGGSWRARRARRGRRGRRARAAAPLHDEVDEPGRS
jgi:signal peptidase II